jgi:hypothetical protein
MSEQTMVTLPNGMEVPLASLKQRRVRACDGCGWPEDKSGELIPATIRIEVAEVDGEGARISALMCGRKECQLSAMARHFEALWPLPVADGEVP